MEQETIMSDSFYCRLCCEENNNGINLFSEEDISEDLHTLVNRYLPIKVESDDPFPKTICPGCHIQLEATKLFMDLIIDGQAKLRTLLKTQQDRFDREEKERQKLEEVLQNHNPNASVETYTIQSDENGEKFIIQIYSEGPLFSAEHELSLKAEGLDKPRRKRGRPPKTITNSESPDSQAGTKEDESNIPVVEEKDKEDCRESTDSDGRKKRIIKAPIRYEGVVQGKELDKILKKEGVIDEEIDDLGEEEKNGKSDAKQTGEDAKTPIGKVVSADGGLEKPVYLNRRPHRVKKYGSSKERPKYTCDICKKEFMHVGRYEIHKKSHKIKFCCQGKDCQVEDENRDVILEHQKGTEHVGISRIEQINEYNGKVVLPDPENPSDSTTETTEIVSEDKPLKCPTCDKSFTCKQNYEVHLKAVHDGEKPFKCEICQRRFAYACSLKVHMISHKNKENDGKIEQFPCDKCSKVFQHPSSLFYHRDTEHGNQRFICNKCNRSFKHRQLLQRHQTVHTEERPFKCTECTLTFKTKTNLLNHENVHRGLKKFTCSICGLSFTHKTSLVVHIRWHEGNKPYECDVCKKAFSQKGNLVEHKRIHTGEKPYTCDLCGRSFTTSSQWKLHSKRHTGEKPYSCEHCQKRFLHKETFDTHIRRHLNIRPFRCLYCTKKFTESWACSRHQRIHLGEKPYHCGVCDKSFTDASNFNKHTKIHLKNGIKPQNMGPATRNVTDAKFASPSIDIQIIIPPESAEASQKEAETEDNQSDLQVQELIDSDGNIISFTTADGQPISIVSSGSENIQGLMPDGTLVSFDIVPEEQNKEQENEPEEEPANQEINLINTEIQYLEDNSSSNSVEKPAFLSEDGKVCFITSFDENSFLAMS